MLRYLDYRNQNITKELNLLIDEIINETLELSQSLYIYKIFKLEKSYNSVKLLNSTLEFNESDIVKHLENSQYCAILAATLGILIDKKIKFYEKVSLTKAVIMDACATAAIESLCDEAENIIKEEAMKLGLYTNYRYSPGYGNFSMGRQFEIVSILDGEKRIGLTVNNESVLIPGKSVTAVIGFQEKKCEKKLSKCRVCKSTNMCKYCRMH